MEIDFSEDGSFCRWNYKIYLPVNNFANCHLYIGFLLIECWTGNNRCRRVLCCQILAKPKLLIKDGIALLSTLHVFVHFTDGNEEVESVGENDAS